MDLNLKLNNFKLTPLTTRTQPWVQFNMMPNVILQGLKKRFEKDKAYTNLAPTWVQLTNRNKDMIEP